ncbi:MAG: tetratricopeptide (TPR) repeat protein [Planctomycetota bacterium]|jgi:tetratricopeptide (TPR) repeat protein
MKGRASGGVWIALGLLLASCSSGPLEWKSSWEGKFAELPLSERPEFERAREDFESGRLEQAEERLRVLTEAYPDQLDLGVLLQEVELGLFASGSGDGGARAAADPDAALAARYSELALSQVSVASLVLAARAATDPLLRKGYLERAIEHNPSCAWAHYGLARSLLQQRNQYRWREAREALDQALSADSGHLGARRLEAWMLSQEGAVPQASKALEHWLRVTESDPRVSVAERTRARIDLAQIWIMAGHPEAAREELVALEGDPVDRSRRLAVLAVAEQEGGQIAAALDAARRAQRADGDSLLSLVQEALIQQYWTLDLEGAETTWNAVVEASGVSSELGDLLQGFRAKVAVERLRKAAESGEQPLPLP